MTTKVEHSSLLNACRWAARGGDEIRSVGCHDTGDLRMGELDDACDARPDLVSIMWANNETGVIHPIEEAVERAHAAGALFHTDAVQALGKLPVDLSRVPVDLLSLAGHKLGGPKGSGVLYVRKGVRVHPRIFGGGQERGLRAGTENVPAIVGLGAACEGAARREPRALETLRTRRDRLQAELLRRCPGGIVFGGEAPRTPNTVCVGWPGVPADRLLKELDRRGVYASSGSACSSDSLDASHVLLALGVSPELARCAIRLSLGGSTTEDEIDRAVEAVSAAVGRGRLRLQWEEE